MNRATSINRKTRLKSRPRRPFPVGKNSCDTGRLAVSVCICTYRRPHLLAELLDSLAEQNFREPFEIIVVDNDAANSAVTTVDNAKMRHPELNIRYSVELQKGISFARNTAVSLARGDFLAWIDDDETAAESWLMSLWATRLINDVDAIWPGNSGFSSGFTCLARTQRLIRAPTACHWNKNRTPRSAYR